jgi:hypothetical protein
LNYIRTPAAAFPSAAVASPRSSCHPSAYGPWQVSATPKVRVVPRIRRAPRPVPRPNLASSITNAAR